MTQHRQPAGVSTGGQYAAAGKDRADLVLGDDEYQNGPCILTGEPGEDPDDCTTHDHEPADPPTETGGGRIVAVADLIPGDMIDFAGDQWQVLDYPRPGGPDGTYRYVPLRHASQGDIEQTFHPALTMDVRRHEPLVTDEPITTALERATDRYVEAQQLVSREAGTELARFTRAHFPTATSVVLDWSYERNGPMLSGVVDGSGAVTYLPDLDDDDWRVYHGMDDLTACLLMTEGERRWPATIELAELPKVGQASSEPASAESPHTSSA